MINHLAFAGNLTRDPTLRVLPNDRSVASFTLAHNRRYKVSGETREEVTFLDCEAWNQTADLVARYCTKGRPLLVEGRLRQDSWDDKESGKRRSRLVLVVDQIHFFPGGDRRSDGSPADPAAAAPSATASAAPAATDDEPPF